MEEEIKHHKTGNLQGWSMFPEFSAFLQRFVGRKVAYAWFSDYSVIYIEFGSVIDASRNHPQHEQHIFLGYDWHLSLNGGLNIERLARQDARVGQLLRGESISTLSLTDEVELRVDFTSGAQLVSHSTVGEAPSWELRELDRCAYFQDRQYHVRG